MATHKLKITPDNFVAVASYKKRAEVRRLDRDYQVGDTLLLQEWTQEQGYSGRLISRTVTHILQGGQYGIQCGFGVLSLQGLGQPRYVN